MNALGWTFFVVIIVGWLFMQVRDGQKARAQNHKDAPVPKPKEESEPLPKPRFTPAAPKTMTRWLEDTEEEPGYVWMKHEVDAKTGEVKF